MGSDVTVSVTAPSKISSHSGFIQAPTVNVTPHRGAPGNGQRRMMVVMASEAQFTERRKRVQDIQDRDIQEPKTIKKEILARLIATSAALVDSGNFLAAMGEEISATQRTDNKGCAPVTKDSGKISQQVAGSKPMDWCRVDPRKVIGDY
ncbi:hypothetical protein R1flu_016164 [Riccia fluitans]|uniref:Uncharacterized protein n=1 Tax=Riccia fluitans TaxID=41844 RepID=A0ABD1YLK0_9MARC